MSDETDQLTVNVEPGLENKRPTKKKPAAKKALPDTTVTLTKRGVRVTGGAKPTASTKKKTGKKSAPKKAGSTSEKKKGKSPKKPLAAVSVGSKVVKTAGASKKTKKLGKSSRKSRDIPSPSPSPSSGNIGSTASTKDGNTKRAYIKRSVEGVDIAGLKPAKEYGISRIEQETKKNFGYYVRVGPPEQRSSVFFSDKKHGSTAKALKAATEKRNELFNALPDWYKVRASKKRKGR